MMTPQENEEAEEQQPNTEHEPAASFERLWEAVDDLADADLADPLDEPEDESIDEPWATVGDLDAVDEDAIDPQDDEEEVPDPWSEDDDLPDPLAALPAPLPPVDIPASMQMPPMSEWKSSSERSRTLAWRTSARLLSPDLGKLICVADPSAPTSRLLVATWEPVDSQGLASLSFRVADDGPQFHAPASRGGEGMLDCELELDGEIIPLRLQLEAARDERGLRLGRDVLAGHFLVDSSKDDL